jgi:hypothetical protein
MSGLERRQRLEDVKALPVIQQLESQSAQRSQIVAQFYESFAPLAVPAQKRTSYSAWLYLALSIPSPAPVLKQALEAIATTSKGRTTNDQALIKTGRKRYILALTSLQQTLLDPRLVQQDETLAAVRTLIFYEFLESTSDDPTAWYNHLDGIAKLIELRGPEVRQSPLGAAVFDELQYIFMAKAIMKRESTMFADPRWNHTSDTDSTGTDQAMCKLGFGLAAILERLDVLKSQPPGIESLTGASKCLSDLNDLFDRAKTLQDELEPDLKTPSEWQRVECTLRTLSLLAIQLLAADISDELVPNLRYTAEQVPDRKDQIVNVCHIAEDHYARTTGITERMRKLFPSCLTNILGYYAPSRALVPINFMIWHFRKSPQDLRELIEVKRAFTSAWSFRFVKHDRLGTWFDKEQLPPPLQNSSCSSGNNSEATADEAGG